MKIDVVMDAIGAFRQLATGLVEQGSETYAELVRRSNGVFRLAFRNLARAYGYRRIYVADPLDSNGDVPDITALAIDEVQRIEMTH